MGAASCAGVFLQARSEGECFSSSSISFSAIYSTKVQMVAWPTAGIFCIFHPNNPIKRFYNHLLHAAGGSASRPHHHEPRPARRAQLPLASANTDALHSFRQHAVRPNCSAMPPNCSAMPVTRKHHTLPMCLSPCRAFFTTPANHGTCNQKASAGHYGVQRVPHPRLCRRLPAGV